MSLKGIFKKTIAQGAATSVLALLGDVQGGGYYSDCKVGRRSELSEDMELARRVWEASDVACGRGRKARL